MSEFAIHWVGETPCEFSLREGTGLLLFEKEIETLEILSPFPKTKEKEKTERVEHWVVRGEFTPQSLHGSSTSVLWKLTRRIASPTDPNNSLEKQTKSSEKPVACFTLYLISGVLCVVCWVFVFLKLQNSIKKGRNGMWLKRKTIQSEQKRTKGKWRERTESFWRFWEALELSELLGLFGLLGLGNL